MKAKRKYFTEQEFWESLNSSQLFNIRSPPPQLPQIFTYSNGAIYQGLMRGGFRDGFGLMRWPDGASYEGDWVYGRAQGHGTFIHTIGDTYSGQWIRDRACAYGEYTSAVNGGTYKGEWKDDMQEGHGVEEWGKD